ncbi:MAG: DUF3489 domain-containing protein [Novosphingobium sp.]
MTDTTTIGADTAVGAKPATKRLRKMARESKGGETAASATADTPSTPIKRESKASQVLGLLQRPEGATLDQLVAATGWLPHTTRAALTGLKKKGHAVTSEKLEGEDRVYRVVAA